MRIKVSKSELRTSSRQKKNLVCSLSSSDCESKPLSSDSNTKPPIRLSNSLHIFRPLTTYLSPCLTAIVCSAKVFNPELGSVTPKQTRSFPATSGGIHFCFCSSVANLTTGSREKTLVWIPETAERHPPVSARV